MQLSLVLASVHALILPAEYSIKIFGLSVFSFFYVLLFRSFLRVAHSLFVAVACLAFTSVLFLLLFLLFLEFMQSLWRFQTASSPMSRRIFSFVSHPHFLPPPLTAASPAGHLVFALQQRNWNQLLI